ncbi:MAG: hypothetical protein R3F41_12260 [Gammaproteobacteria bacterium]|nr:hypothetical protein [Pseudomonadales bacterium]MCP5348869.1 hypothetical protein [Pseudomonadales bacterium]
MAAKTLPYHVRTGTGDRFELEFPLHPDTREVVRISQLLSAILAAIDHDIATMGETSNGDVLQAVSMALAIRARMIHAPFETAAGLSQQLVDQALEAVARSERLTPRIGHA